MKILYASQSFYPSVGGVSYYLLWLCRRLRRMGHQVHVVHLGPPKLPVEDKVEGIRVHRISALNIDIEVLRKYLRFREKLWKAFHGMEVEEAESVEDVYGFDGYETINSMYAERIRALHHEHGFDLMHFHDFQMLLLGKMLSELGVPKVFTWHIPFTKEAPDRWKEFVIDHLKHYDVVVFSTKHYLRDAVLSGMGWDRVFCIPPFVDVDRPEKNEFRQKYPIGERDRIVLCVARMDPLKDHPTLIHAMRKVVDEVGKDVKCVVIGNGSLSKEVLKVKERIAYEEGLKQLVKELGLEENVIFTGGIPRGDVMQAYECCDMVVLPSVKEGFGLALTEGMAFGKPVIGTAVGGIIAQIWPGVNGYLVKPGDVEGLANAIVKLLKDEELRRRMGEKAREIYEEYYGIDRGVRDHLRLYQLVLGEEL